MVRNETETKIRPGDFAQDFNKIDPLFCSSSTILNKINRLRETQHNDTQYKDAQHHDTQDNETNNAQHNHIKCLVSLC
jgi:hypothetical protein